MAIRGDVLDRTGRCVHHKTPLDVVAFRFGCCEGAWACRACHDDRVDHETVLWDPARPEPCVLCGACGFAMTAKGYQAALDAGDACPACTHPWNPGCREHHDRYFATLAAK